MRLPRTTARARILGLTTLVVAGALVVTVVVLRQVLISELESRLDRSLVQEADELAETTRNTERLEGEDAVAYAERVLETFLTTNVPSDDEVLVAVSNGTPFLESRDAPGDIKDEIPAFTDVTVPTFANVSTPDGDVRILAQPIVDSGEQVGLLVIGLFTDNERRRIDDTIRDASTVALAALVAAVAMAWIVAGRVLRPIGTLAETAREITEHDLSRRIPSQGSDEIEAMIHSFNSMLDRLQNAVATQRRFLDDAGHELRTPLTIIRGHLEVTAAEEATTPDPVVLREIDRMTRIVDDLLVLARAENVEFLRIVPIDADAFIERISTLVAPLGDQEWVVEEVPIGVVHADPDRLTQAVLNLASNAARHTPDGGRIGIGARVDDGFFSIWVRDTGDGVAPDQRDLVFERFHRATSERSDGGSAGLGLSIVAAIVKAHGGRIDLDTEVGVGSTFIITIPQPTDITAEDPDASAGSEEHERFSSAPNDADETEHPGAGVDRSEATEAVQEA